MKKTKLCIVFLIFLSGISYSQSFQAGAGVDFFTYSRNFLDLHAVVLQPLKKDVELFLGGSFAIATEKNGDEVTADFFLPFDGGVNFLFPVNTKLSYVFGLGLTAQFLLEDEDRFYMGPFLKGGLRYKVHPYMTWYAEVAQDLVIGKPDWINYSTRLNSGIIFNFD